MVENQIQSIKEAKVNALAKLNAVDDEVAHAMPVYEKAKKALGNLRVSSINELKTLTNPPKAI